MAVAPIALTGPRPRIFTLPPSQPAPQAPGGSSQEFVDNATKAPPGGPPGLFEQLSDIVTGLPSGLAGMAVDAGRDVQGIGRVFKDVATGAGTGDNPDDYFPLLTGFQHSIARTGGRFGNLAASLVPGGQTPGESEYGRAIKNGTIVPTLLEDAGNVALAGSLVSKGLSAGATAATRGAVEKAATDGLTSEAAARATADEAAARAAAAAHPLGQAATQFDRLIHPVNGIASAPARVWTAPVKAVTGFDLPRIFGTAEDGAARRVGLIPALQSTGVIDRLAETPTGQAFKTAVDDWQTNRAQRRDVRENYLLQQTAQSHVEAAKLNAQLQVARKIISDGVDDPALVESYEHANHLIHTGAAPVIRQAVDLSHELPQEQWDQVMFQTFGREQLPTPATMDLVLKYHDGTLPPEVKDRLDAAWEAEHKALAGVEDVKLEGEGRKFGPLSEEQLGHEPVPYKVEAKLAPWQEKRQALADLIEGRTTPTGDRIPGLRDELAAAKAAVPETEPGLLVSARAAAAARRAGALTGEQSAAVKGAERLEGAAGRAADKVQAARDAALQAEEGLKARPDLTENEAVTFTRSVRARIRDQIREQRATLEAPYADHLPIKIPARGTAEWDLFQQLQGELASASGTSAERANFRNMTTTMIDPQTGRPIPFFAKGQGTPIDRVRDLVHGGDEEAFARDIRALAETRQAEGAVVRDGLPRGLAQGYAQDPMEGAALLGDLHDAAREVIGAHADWVAREPRASMQPWRSLGRAEGQERVFQTETNRADAQAVKLEPKINAAEARAQAAEEQGVGKAVRFGERVGKATRDVQLIERDLARKVKTLAWLDDKKIPELEGRLSQGPAEVAPGAYQPALQAGIRFKAAVTQMGADLAEQSGDPSLASKFDAMASDAAVTMDALHQAGVYPEYVPGAVDAPTKGSPSVPGGQEQLPYLGATPSEHAKTYGHIPKRIVTVQRSLTREMGAVVRNQVAERFSQEIAKPATNAIREAVNEGKLDGHVADALLERWKADPSIDLAKELERHGYSGWDANSPEGRVPDRRVTAETLVIPTPILTEFQRWFKPATNNPLIRLYDKATQGFKHSVLALSPQWNIYNVFGNAFMATFGAGETPMTIARYAREARRLLQEQDVTGEQTLPARLFGAGQSAEISRMMADQGEPRTMIGRAINKSYALNETVDNIGRSAVYLAKIAKGYAPDEAVRLSLQAMGDFSNLSPFERNVVRRVIPFYAWMKHVSQATAHLALEHPWRVAVLLHMADMFSDPGDKNLPDWLRGSFHIADGVFLPAGSLNPYATSAGSIFTNPADWPSEALRSLNPVLKLGAGAIGINTSQGRPVTHAPGTGYADEFGKDKFGFIGAQPLAYMASQLIPQGRLARDLIADPVVRYDTGDPVKRQGVPIPTEGGRWGAVSHDLGIPFMPIFVNEQEQKARIFKAAQARAKAAANYNK